MLCIDSSANILSLLTLLARNIAKVVKTAAAGCKSSIQLQPCAFSALLHSTGEFDADKCHYFLQVDQLHDIFCCQIIACEYSHGGDSAILFVIDCVQGNGLWRISKQQMLDIVHRHGFPLVETQ